MTTLKRSAILLRLVRDMRAHGSWCGETHVQKAVYLLQDVAGADSAFDFVLYKHGPFSFELRDQLTSMRADDLLELLVQPQPYGPKLAPAQNADKIEAKFPNTIARNKKAIDFIADAIADRGVAELERLATAVYVVRRDLPDADNRERAQRLSEIKPHISIDQAKEAVGEAEAVIQKAQEKGLPSHV
ncbi:MAG: hypothetical protein K8T91_14680 [Planctomycetes bacterium]|nr:hypothetical protein [Planctomycetota bacterium]